MNERQQHRRRVRDHLRQARKGPAPTEDGCYHRILGIHEMRADQTFQFAAVRVSEADPKLDDKLVMIQMAKDLLTQALRIDGYDPALSISIRAAVQGEPPVFHWLGEFFQSYGMFQQTYNVYGTQETREKLEGLLGAHEFANDAWYDGYRGRGPDRVPLPFAVRNTLAHPDVENEITYSQVTRATEILGELVRLFGTPPQLSPP